jgi:hypothetical protein
MRGKRRVAGSVLGVFLVLGAVPLGIYGTGQAIRYGSGEPTTAHVDRCAVHTVTSTSYSNDGTPHLTRHPETVCDGSWRTADGRRHSGQLDGFTSTADQGRTVRVRVDGNHAMPDSLWRLWPLGAAVLCLVAGLLPVWLRRRRGGRTRRSGPVARTT